MLVKALVLGVVEGLTEFLPVSSTGHLILAADLIDFTGPKAQVFEIVIQTGAMLAVVWQYRGRFGRAIAGILSEREAQQFALQLLVAFLPAACLGLLFAHAIKQYLFKPVPVALAFIVGGLIILWVERRPRPARVESVDAMTWMDALKVGCAQAVALIPGTSRSGATIIGGMLFGLSRRAATEFSFFLAVPTLVAAGAYDFYKNRALFHADDAGIFLVGSIAAFAAAFACVRWLLAYISSHDFKAFAWYRIAFGALVLVSSQGGWIAWARG